MKSSALNEDGVEKSSHPMGPETEPEPTSKDPLDQFFGAVTKLYKTYQRSINIAIAAGVIVAFFVYFSFALACHFGDEGSIRLVGLLTC